MGACNSLCACIIVFVFLNRACAVRDCANPTYRRGKYCFSHHRVEAQREHEERMLSEAAILPEGSIGLFPIADNVFIDITRVSAVDPVGSLSRGEGQWVKTVKAEQHLSLSDCVPSIGVGRAASRAPSPAVFYCKAFGLLRPILLKPEDLANGTFSHLPPPRGVRRLSPEAIVTTFGVFDMLSFFVRVNADGTIDGPRYYDIGGKTIEFKFQYQDAPITNQEVHGAFTAASSLTSAPEEVRVMTNDKGVSKLTVPSGGGTIQAEVRTESDEAVVRVEIPVSARQPIAPGLEKPPENVSKATEIGAMGDCTILFNLDVGSKNVALLGDTSGSMDGARLGCLRISMFKSFFESVQDDVPIALATWTSETDICLNKYLELDDRCEVENWINSMNAEGGTNLRQALETILTTFPDLEQIFVVCDGDMSPFTVDGTGLKISASDAPYSPYCKLGDLKIPNFTTYTWQSFRALHPNVRFHFIGIEDGVDVNVMGRMAEIGNGNLTVAKGMTV